ncbi:MAG: M48 family metalloprotease, partial [Coleofasciculus sp. S288]|nr:M48 family metalloprotease [Coleofasciculus sp. S288]
MSSVPNPSLDDGLHALNQGDYSVAIAHLEGVRETELDDSLVTRASQALVMAYQGNGNTENAIALCQQLAHHPNPTVREWASATLADLAAGEGLNPPTDVQSATPSNPTGFVAFTPTSSQTKTPSRGTPSTIKQQPAGSTKGQFSGQARQQRPPHASDTPSDASRLAKTALSENSRINSASTPENLQPVSFSPASTSDSSDFWARRKWRNSGRAQKWSPLKPSKLIRLWAIEIVSAIAFFWVLRFTVRFLMQNTNFILVKLPVLEPFQPFYRDPTLTLGILVVILLITSPWLIDGLLKGFHGFQTLSLTQLSCHSPEAARVVQRVCRQRRLPQPKLGILPTDAPVALTYGNLPQTARIVISEGLFSQLADDEIATLYANQLGHILNWDFVLMSLGVLIIQIPYLIYWQVARWGEQLSGWIERKLPSWLGFLSLLVSGIAGVVAAVSYGVYWVLRLPLLWLSRARVYYSDRLAAETTGNPNGLTRALLKSGIGIAGNIQNEGKTSRLLESLDLLLPVGYQQAIPLSSCSP